MNPNPRQSLSFVGFVLVSAVAFLLAGCTGAENALYERRVETLPGVILATNTVYRTNIVVLEVTKTNEITGEITPPKLQQLVTPEITYSYAPPTLITNLVPRPIVEEALKTTGGLPLPFAGTAALLLGWAYSGYAAMRNKRLGVAVIKSVQAGREFLQSTPEGKKLDEQFKATLAQHQTYSGVVNEVKQLLDRYVDKT